MKHNSHQIKTQSCFYNSSSHIISYHLIEQIQSHPPLSTFFTSWYGRRKTVVVVKKNRLTMNNRLIFKQRCKPLDKKYWNQTKSDQIQTHTHTHTHTRLTHVAILNIRTWLHFLIPSFLSFHLTILRPCYNHGPFRRH